MNTKKQTGFTIVELLIVIVVIGILAAITVATFNSMQGRARDSQRAADARAITQALEQYKIVNGSLPTQSYSGLGSQAGWEVSAREAPGQFLLPLKSANFPSGTPVDPINDAVDDTEQLTRDNGHHGYYYYVYPAGSYGCDASRGRFYIFGIINMEATVGAHSDSPGFSCTNRNWQTEFKWVKGGYEY